MSADNGYVIQKNKEDKYVIQMYFASSDEYPNPNDSELQAFDTLEEAIDHYRDVILADGYPPEYGLVVAIPNKEKDLENEDR